nr:cuticle collagen 2-like [Manis javanica]
MSKEKVLPPSPYLIHCSMKPCDKVNENYQSLTWRFRRTSRDPPEEWTPRPGFVPKAGSWGPGESQGALGQPCDPAARGTAAPTRQPRGRTAFSRTPRRQPALRRLGDDLCKLGKATFPGSRTGEREPGEGRREATRMGGARPGGPDGGEAADRPAEKGQHGSAAAGSGSESKGGTCRPSPSDPGRGPPGATGSAWRVRAPRGPRAGGTVRAASASGSAPGAVRAGRRRAGLREAS